MTVAVNTCRKCWKKLDVDSNQLAPFSLLINARFFQHTDKATDNVYIMMEARISELFKAPEDYDILDRWV